MVIVKIIPIIATVVVNAFLIRLIVDTNRKRNRSVASACANVAERRNRAEQRITVMLVAISAMMFLCHVVEPFSHPAIYRAIHPQGDAGIGSDEHRLQRVITNILEMFSYASKFFIYVIFYQQFQPALKQVLCHRSSRAVNPESVFMVVSAAGGNHILHSTDEDKHVIL